MCRRSSVESLSITGGLRCLTYSIVAAGGPPGNDNKHIYYGFNVRYPALANLINTAWRLRNWVYDG